MSNSFDKNIFSVLFPLNKMGESGHCMKLQGLYFAIVCEIEYSIMQKGLLTLFAPAYMGQFLQDGKNDQTLSKNFFFAASL